MRYLVLILLLIPMTGNAKEPLSIVVVGGGPVGLAAAIEAVDSGAQVTVVEKRKEYTRRQIVYLSDQSLQLLDRWHVTLPSEFVFKVNEEESIGLVPIHLIEELLSEQALQRGVIFIKGKFEKIESEQQVQVRSGDEIVFIAYDLLVGADGAQSKVRKELGITVENFGKRQGAFASVQLGSSVVGLDITEAIQTESGFIRRIKSPRGNIIVSQGFTQGVDELLNAAVLQGWNEEAQLIREGRGAIVGEIPLVLMKADRFSDSVLSAIILGDASATGSFILGLGLNMGFETVSNAVVLFQSLFSEDAKPYSAFEEKMHKTADSMIEENRFLFQEPEWLFQVDSVPVSAKQ